MSSPLPPDPYTALGVSKDADVAQIRTAHRKLVLKYHPDRIRGDDIEEKNRAKDEFQRVQQAYELLVDPSKRDRYDNQCRLAELQRERIVTREAARPMQHPSKNASSSSSFVKREMRKDGNVYEERAPADPYSDDNEDDNGFDDPPPRVSSRKNNAPYEKDRKSSMPKPEEKKERVSARMASPVEGISLKAAFNLKSKATEARERVRVREGFARSQETRDREKRRDRSDKHSSRRSAHVEDAESDSEVETIPQSRQEQRSARPSTRPAPEPAQPRSRPSARGIHNDDDSADEVEPEKWERHHKNSMDYQAESKKRPHLVRNDSSVHSYWGGDSVPTSRRNTSDSERRSSNSRRTKADEFRSRPSMPIHNSAPVNLKPYVEDRKPERSRTDYPTDREQRPVPNLPRSQTMPNHKSSKRDTAPPRGSNLKHSETQDSGYYSSSNSRSPEMKGESPPPTREDSRKKTSNSTRYQIVTPEDDDRGSRIRILNSDDEKFRRTRSPEPDPRSRVQDRDQDRDKGHGRRETPVRAESDLRTRPSKAPSITTVTPGLSRSESARFEANSPRSSNRKLFGEVRDSSDEKDSTYSRRYETPKVTSYRPPVTTAAYTANYIRSGDIDPASRSTYRDTMQYPTGRRSSTAH